MSQRLLSDRAYRKDFRERLREGKLPPAVECMLYHYAYGKPPDSLTIEDEDGAPVGQVTFVVKAR